MELTEVKQFESEWNPRHPAIFSTRITRQNRFDGAFHGWPRATGLILTLWFGISFVQPLHAQEPNQVEQRDVVEPRADQPGEMSPVTAPAEPQPIPDPEFVAAEEEKRKKIAIMMSAIGGIAILGVGTIAVLMLWARHLRRVAREMGPVQHTAGNDFWFLKPPKPPVSDANVGETHRPGQAIPDGKKPE